MDNKSSKILIITKDSKLKANENKQEPKKKSNNDLFKISIKTPVEENMNGIYYKHKTFKDQQNKERIQETNNLEKIQKEHYKPKIYSPKNKENIKDSKLSCINSSSKKSSKGIPSEFSRETSRPKTPSDKSQKILKNFEINLKEKQVSTIKSKKNENSKILAKEESQTNASTEGYDNSQDKCPLFIRKLSISKNQKKSEEEKWINDLKQHDSINDIESQEAEDNQTSENINEMKELLEKNKEWVKETLEKNPTFLKEISSPQHPKYLIISCSDSRILTSKILGTHPGELFVHRNIGNIILSADFNIQSVLSYAIENLKVKNIIVLGHTDCGAIKTSLSNKYHGLIDHWLKPIKDVVERHHDMLDVIMKKNPDQLTTKLSELNVKEQVINLCKNPILQKAWNEGQELYIHGLLFDMDTGYIKDLKTMKKEWKPIEDIHLLDFH